MTDPVMNLRIHTNIGTVDISGTYSDVVYIMNHGVWLTPKRFYPASIIVFIEVRDEHSL